MGTIAPKSRVDLGKEYNSDSWFNSLVEHLSLVSLLESCVIRRNYKIPDALNQAIKLSEMGTKVQRDLTTQENVPVKEARLITYLHALHVDPLVDFEGTSVDGIRNAVSGQILKGDLIYPYTYGRALYDRAAGLFRDERERLKHEDTLELLAEQQPGVFHMGHNLIGPYGLLTTDFQRTLQPRTRIPLQHCSDTACRRVHSVQLTTSHEADINRYRPAIRRVLDNTSPEPSDWNGYIQDRLMRGVSEYADDGNPGVSLILGDALDDQELRSLFEYILDASSGSLRKACGQQGLSGRATELSRPLSRQQMHQLLLTQSDEDLVRHVDEAITSQVIKIPQGEVRTLRVNAGRTVSAWHLRPQISRFGYRTVGNDAEVPALRLGELIRKLYDLGQQTEIDELEWHLRQQGQMPLSARLEHILRTQDPSDVVKRLVFARRANQVKACEALGVATTASESEMVDRIVWKLGFRLRDDAGVLNSYWTAHRDLERLARSSIGPGEVPVDELRGKTAAYGVALEGYLSEALNFAWWALLNDHYGSARSFVYRPLAARDFARDGILRAATREKMTEFADGDKLTLNSLMAGFGLLARELRRVISGGDQHLRSDSDKPRFASSTTMQQFPFAHTVPVLDLDATSQQNIIDMLTDATSKLQGSEIAAARNSFLHAGRETASPQTIVTALSSVQAVLTGLESAGLVPKPFRYVRSDGDRWGRRAFTMSTDDQDTHVIHSPSKFDWIGLPSRRADQTIFRAATIGDGIECLRFLLGKDSRYESYWEGFPQRRVRAEGYVETNSDLHTSSVLGSSSE
jgi:hypothetical protein